MMQPEIEGLNLDHIRIKSINSLTSEFCFDQYYKI